MPSPSQRKGTAIEDRACAYLQHHGLRICQRNYVRKTGEIDIIAQEGDMLVFTEVRFRAQQQFGKAFETVNAAKQRRIINTAKLYLQQHRQAQQFACRFDIISASLYNDQLTIEWLKNAF